MENTRKRRGKRIVISDASIGNRREECTRRGVWEHKVREMREL